MPKRPTVPALLTAYEAQAAAIDTWLGQLPDSALVEPSSLAGWSIGELVVHIVGVPAGLLLARNAPRPPRGTAPLTVGTYTAAYAEAGAQIADRAREQAATFATGGRGLAVAELRRHLAAESAAMREVCAGLDAELVVAARRGPIRLGDMLRTRVAELVVHARDLTRSQPAGDPVELPRAPLGIAVRMLTEILVERQPGRSVEVRVPPFAAVQCVVGATHTRGTPPNVVETDPVTFVDIASGRREFADASADGAVRASGTRADLSAYLPLLG